MEEERLWKFRKPEWLNSVHVRNSGVYGAGALFSLAFYIMLDSAVWSHSARNGSNVHVHFVDWLPLVFSSLGMLIINSVEKQRLSADSFSYSGSGVAWKARVVLFLGFAALAGGMAGGVTVFVLKFIVPGVGMPALSMGIENVVSNALVGVSSVVLWVSQNMEDEYSYNLSLHIQMAERPRGTNGAVSRARPSAAPVRRNLFQSQLTRRPTPSSSNSAETVRLEGETSRESTDIVPRDHNGNHILEFPPTLALLDDGDEPPPDEHQELESEIARGSDSAWRKQFGIIRLITVQLLIDQKVSLTTVACCWSPGYLFARYRSPGISKSKYESQGRRIG
ncbi:hypothetical protein S7711_09436 [Stachybotrys chartarum IBT 7711]|uniref:Uncharacterized protein n=1 Tax=Stachybotrys chartarum (strain CBS 109288 / IBT 7711) TaxID=1280523 RepID=A0A084B2Z9_STACB|nr:hypothetical protein S7711_09436 [Stachybotrys chartarum IBT 7711]KFA78554.1 hypothetical protein S40288_01503 [Stachybotrys chartarum IBT 40288]